MVLSPVVSLFASGAAVPRVMSGRCGRGDGDTLTDVIDRINLVFCRKYNVSYVQNRWTLAKLSVRSFNEILRFL